MPRVQYETETDLANERAVVDVLSIETFPNLVFRKSTNNAVDFIGADIDGTDKLGIEIKCRNGNATRYAEYFVAKQKIDKALAFRRESGLPVYMIWAWDDWIAGIEIAPQQHFRTDYAGRTVQTRDAWDIEEMIYIHRDACFFVNYAGQVAQ